MVVTRSSDQVLRPDEVTLFSVTGDGRLNIAEDGRRPEMQPGDTVIIFVGGRSPEASGERADQTRDRALRSS